MQIDQAMVDRVWRAGRIAGAAGLRGMCVFDDGPLFTAWLDGYAAGLLEAEAKAAEAAGDLDAADELAAAMGEPPRLDALRAA